jgi:hypothetical protein
LVIVSIAIIALSIVIQDPTVWAMIVPLFIFLVAIVTFAILANAPGLTDEEKHAPSKMPKTEEKVTEKEIPPKPSSDNKYEPFLCVCIILIVITIIFLPSSSDPYGYPSSFPFLIPIIAIIIVPFFCLVAYSQYEENSLKTDSGSPRVTSLSSAIASSKRRLRIDEGLDAQIHLAKTETGQLFWQTEGTKKPQPKSVTSKVRAVRGGEIIGGRFRFKVKVLNESLFTINDVTVYVLSYPRDTLILKAEDDDVFFSKIEPQGFRSPTFDFLPTQDCVRGEIVAGVSYVDATGKAHTLTTESFTIRAVCDLLQPSAISPKNFEIKLKELESGEILLKVEEWTPEEMQEKTLRVLSDSNFHEVASEESETDGVMHFKVSGWATGKYTGKSVGAEIFISGVSRQRGASCRIRIAGEDDAMILPAIDDLKERLSAYLCPMCGSKLTMDNVQDLKKGKIVCCPFCDVSIGS